MTLAVVDRLIQRAALCPSGCVEWTGTKNRGGYGRIGALGKRVLVHRVAYEAWAGPIPEGMQLDHLCRNRACFNPRHLEPVTQRENTLRGVGPSAQRARSTTCKFGHPLEKKPIKSRNTRHCKTCKNAEDRRYGAAFRRIAVAPGRVTPQKIAMLERIDELIQRHGADGLFPRGPDQWRTIKSLARDGLVRRIGDGRDIDGQIEGDVPIYDMTDLGRERLTELRKRKAVR